MNRIDFNFFDDESWKAPIKGANFEELSKASNDLAKLHAKNKEFALVEAVEIIEGKVPSTADVKKYGQRCFYETNKDVEEIWWKGKAILRFKIEWKDNKSVLHIMKLYNET
jgi:hypothetical protein